MRLFDQEAPRTVANFVGLAEGTKQWKDPRTNQTVTQPYYNGVIFHRVIDSFMIQSGDPLGEGIGGPGYTFADEFHPKLRHNKAGILSMANRGPNTNGGQFFITLGADSSPGRPALRVRRGRRRHGRGPQDWQRATNERDRPINPIVIRTITVERQQS